jgi:hypothetical protein
MNRILSVMVIGLSISSAAMAYVECEPPVVCSEEWSYGNQKQVEKPVQVQRPRPFVVEREVEVVKPTPSIMIRGNQRVTVKTMDSVAIPDYSYTPEPQEKKKLSGPSMGYQGYRKIRTFHAGSHQSDWKFAPKQVRYE